MSNDIFEMINIISKDIEIDGNKTVVHIENTDNQDIKKLSLKSGSWDLDNPWLILGDDQKVRTMIPINSVNKFIKKYRDIEEENFQLKLEKIIWQNIPIDFQDVWVVAMSEIKIMAKDEKRDKKVINIDLEKLIKKIKNEHPNLFLNLKDLNVLSR